MDDETVVSPTETVLDSNAETEVLVTDLVNVQQSHGEVYFQRPPTSRTAYSLHEVKIKERLSSILRFVHLVVDWGETDRAAARLVLILLTQERLQGTEY